MLTSYKHMLKITNIVFTFYLFTFNVIHFFSKRPDRTHSGWRDKAFFDVVL